MNNMIAKKLQPQPSSASADGAEVKADLDRRLQGLQQRLLAIIEEIILAEKSGQSQRDEVRADAEEAEGLLKGGEFVASRQTRMSHLAALHAEQIAIEAALKVGRSRSLRLAAERAGEIWSAYFAEISAIERTRVFLAFELKAINRKREMLREKIVSEGGAGSLTTDGVDLIDTEQTSWAAERLIADGIATRREIEKASSNG